MGHTMITSKTIFLLLLLSTRPVDVLLLPRSSATCVSLHNFNISRVTLWVSYDRLWWGKGEKKRATGRGWSIGSGNRCGDSS